MSAIVRVLPPETTKPELSTWVSDDASRVPPPPRVRLPFVKFLRLMALKVPLLRSRGEAGVMETFSEPGDYLVRVRATDSSITEAGHAQCCWTNAYLRVTVKP